MQSIVLSMLIEYVKGGANDKTRNELHGLRAWGKGDYTLVSLDKNSKGNYKSADLSPNDACPESGN